MRGHSSGRGSGNEHFISRLSEMMQGKEDGKDARIQSDLSKKDRQRKQASLDRR
jgi:hypothetical protein